MASNAASGSSTDDGSMDAEAYDRYVADVILKEAQARSQGRQADFSRVSFDHSSSGEHVRRAAPTSKRFLASIIRSTDDHNRGILLSHAERTKGVPPRDHLEPSHVKDRPAASSEPKSSRRAESSNAAGVTLDHRPRYRSPVPSDERSKGTRSRRSSDRRDRPSAHRETVRPLSTSGHSHADSGKRHSSCSRASQDVDEGPYAANRTCSRSDKDQSDAPSKMDKYFSPAYDPQLDITLDHSTDGHTGLITDGGWDALCSGRESSRDRRKKSRSSTDRHSHHHRARTDRKRRKQDEEEEAADRRRRKRAQADVMDTGMYIRKGQMRAWDLGKAS